MKMMIQFFLKMSWKPHLFTICCFFNLYSFSQQQGNDIVPVTNKRLAVFMIDFPDTDAVTKSTFPTPNRVKDSITSSYMTSYFDDISYGQFSYTADVFGYFTHQNSFVNPQGTWQEFSDISSINSINVPNFNHNNYDIFVLISVSEKGLAGARQSTGDILINGAPISKKVVFVPISMPHVNYPGVGQGNFVLGGQFYKAFKHEFIHGMRHAGQGSIQHAYSNTNGSSYDYEPEVSDNHYVGNPQFNFSHDDYGHNFCVMGSGANATSLNGCYRDMLGWTNSSNRHSFKGYGEYQATIYPINTENHKTIVEIRIPYDYSFSTAHKNKGYFLELRSNNDPWDAGLNDPEYFENTKGIMVVKTDGGSTQLLDMSPSPNIMVTYSGGQQQRYADKRDVVLKPGMVYDNKDITLSNVVSNPDGSYTVTVRIKENPNFVVTPNSANTVNSWIQAVSIENTQESHLEFSETTGNNNGYYEHNSPLTVKESAQHNLTLTPGFSGSQMNLFYKVLIDYDGDGYYYGSGEEVLSGTMSGGNPLQTSFTTPTGFTFGDAWMRVIVQETPISGHTLNGLGEVEDIKISKPEPLGIPSPWSWGASYLSKVQVDLDGSTIMENASAYNTYTDYTGNPSLLTMAYLGDDLEISISTSKQVFYDNSYLNNYVRVWIDWNQNGVLEDAEKVIEGITDNTGKISGNAVIPQNAILGGTVMRVSMGVQHYMEPIGNAVGYGDYEDYSIIVQEEEYCQPSPNATAAWLNFMAITDPGGQQSALVNQSGNNNGYADFTSTASLSNFSFSSGGLYNVYLTPGFPTAATSMQRQSIWIDLNNDGDFDDTDELIVAMSSHSMATASIMIPYNAYSGPTRMRVILSDTYVTDPCNVTNGEVEDYTVTIVKPSYCEYENASPNSSSAWLDFMAIVDQGGQQPALVNQSGNNNGYADFTSTNSLSNFSFISGGSYNLYLTPAFPTSTSSMQRMSVWVDLNYDGDFDDANELIVALSATSMATASFYFPASIYKGPTRMRVIASDAYVTDPCSAAIGEVEDYTVTIQQTSTNMILPHNAPTEVDRENYFSSIEPKSFNMALFPNPTKEISHLHFYSEAAQNRSVLRLIDLSSGRIVLERPLEENEVEKGELMINFEQFASGAYMVDLSNDIHQEFIRVVVP